MLRLQPVTTTEVVKLSYWVFGVWWSAILGMHVVTCVYNGLYAYCYWELQHTYLNAYLQPFEIGMPPPHHYTIAIVYATMSAVHGFCILLMLGGSLWQRSLAFTPWTNCNAGTNVDEVKTARTSSILIQSVSKVYDKIVDRHGLCGVNGKYFHIVLICREIIETALQTVQAYRMSMLLPQTLLNRFYVILIAINCWSSVAVYSAIFRRDEARRRLACIVLDCMLDLMACMGVELIVLLSYADKYVTSIRGFDQYLWYDDEWAARAINEFRILVVVSWSDLMSRTIFSLGLVLTTTSMKELLQRLPRNENRVIQLPRKSKSDQAEKLSVVFPIVPVNILPKLQNPKTNVLLEHTLWPLKTALTLSARHLHWCSIDEAMIRSKHSSMHSIRDRGEHVAPTVASIFFLPAHLTMLQLKNLPPHSTILRCFPKLSRKFPGLKALATMSTVEDEPRAVMIPIADGTEEIEAIAVADVLTRGGMKVTLASVGRKMQNIVTMSQGTKVQGDIAIEACEDLSFDLIMCPGGPGAQHLHDSAELITMLQKQRRQGRYYGGICAAPVVVLIPHGLLDAGLATTYPSYGSKMTGVDYKPHERVVVNGKCVTSHGPGTAIEMGLKLVGLLCSEEKAKCVAQALVV